MDSQLDRCALFRHSCPKGSPSVLTSCLPAPATHASHTGVGKTGPESFSVPVQEPLVLSPAPVRPTSPGSTVMAWCDGLSKAESLPGPFFIGQSHSPSCSFTSPTPLPPCHAPAISLFYFHCLIETNRSPSVGPSVCPGRENHCKRRLMPAAGAARAGKHSGIFVCALTPGLEAFGYLFSKTPRDGASSSVVPRD